MSVIKDLKNRAEYNVNLVNIFSELYSTNKTKYIELILRLYSKNDITEELLAEENKDIDKLQLDHIEKSFPKFNREFFEKMSIFDRRMVIYLTNPVGRDFWSKFQKFIDYNERGLIVENDVTKYKKFEDILSSVENAEIREYEDSLKKQIVTIHNDFQWIVLRPLTYESSKKYGANTKWCTSSENDKSYFRKYSIGGILIYCINKLNGLKVAAHKNIERGEITFWNQLDKQIDSMESGLPENIVSLIRKEFIENKSNVSFLSLQDIEIEFRSPTPRKDFNLPGMSVREIDHSMAVTAGIDMRDLRPAGDEIEDMNFNDEDEDEGDEEVMLGEIDGDGDEMEEAPVDVTENGTIYRGGEFIGEISSSRSRGTFI